MTTHAMIDLETLDVFSRENEYVGKRKYDKQYKVYYVDYKV